VDSKITRETLLRLQAEQRRIACQIAEVQQQLSGHVSDHDLERYHLQMILDEAELAPVEEHLLWCHFCVERGEKAAEFIDALKAAAAEQDGLSINRDEAVGVPGHGSAGSGGGNSCSSAEA
jgi:hypothetical protein